MRLCIHVSVYSFIHVNFYVASLHEIDVASLHVASLHIANVYQFCCGNEALCCDTGVMVGNIFQRM